MGVGDKIRELRRLKNWSQQDLANKTGIIRATISQFELNMVRDPSADKLLKIAQALEVDVKVLYSAAGYPTSPETSNDVILRELEEIDVKLRDIMARLRQ